MINDENVVKICIPFRKGLESKAKMLTQPVHIISSITDR